MRVVVADPAWMFGDKLPGKTRGASKQYGCLSVDEIVSILRVATDGERDLVLFLWRVAALQVEAIRVCSRLDVTIKTELVWEKLTKHGKPHFGMGHYVRASHETCLIAVRGRALPAVRNVRSRFSAPVRAHSQKPELFYEIVETMYPSAEKHELFARTVRPCWTQHGDQLGTLALEAAQ